MDVMTPKMMPKVVPKTRAWNGAAATTTTDIRVRPAVHHTRRPARRTPQGRPAVSGMIEVLILAGIAVAMAGILGAWLGGAGGLSDAAAGGCTLRVTFFEDVGSGGRHFLAVTFVNTGDRVIENLRMTSDGSILVSNSSAQAPGAAISNEYAYTQMRPESLAAVVGYSDGSTALCNVRVYAESAG